VPTVPRLKALREGAFLSQDELAHKSGVAQPTISHLERGRPARFGTIRKLAKALRVTPSELGLDAPAELPTPSPEPQAIRTVPRKGARSRLDVGLDRAHALAEAEWAMREGDLAGAARWERLADELLAKGD